MSYGTLVFSLVSSRVSGRCFFKDEDTVVSTTSIKRTGSKGFVNEIVAAESPGFSRGEEPLPGMMIKRNVAGTHW